MRRKPYAVGEENLETSSIVVDRPVAFTAQSKRYFYCAPAVCAFTLDLGFVPINPFQLYDYFLGDMVERDLVRQANNNLIRISDELWVFGAEIADGVLFEIKYAMSLGKPVRYFTIDSDPENIHPISIADLTFEQELLEKAGSAEYLRAQIQV